MYMSQQVVYSHSDYVHGISLSHNVHNFPELSSFFLDSHTLLVLAIVTGIFILPLIAWCVRYVWLQGGWGIINLSPLTLSASVRSSIRHSSNLSRILWLASVIWFEWPPRNLWDIPVSTALRTRTTARRICFQGVHDSTLDLPPSDAHSRTLRSIQRQPQFQDLVEAPLIISSSARWAVLSFVWA